MAGCSGCQNTVYFARVILRRLSDNWTSPTSVQPSRSRISRSSPSSVNRLLPPVLAGILFCSFGLVQAAGAGKVDISPEAREFFERNIRPALAENCFVCHSVDLAQGELRLDSPDGWEKGGKSGPAIIPGDPDASLLIRALRHQGPGLPMPLGGEQLSAELIDVFERWVRLGAAAPKDATGPEAGAADEADSDWEQVYQDRSRWWSLQPVAKPAVPEVQREEWSDQPVDRFLLAKLEANGLTPAPRADRRTRLRRVSYLLTGLPPKPDEVAAFLRNPDPEAAYAQEVDRLLDSSHFGEEWARHWMDVVRYSDTYGYETDAQIKGSWLYRNYLIRAFNADIPFDQLVHEHIAGDLLSQPRIDAARQINESMIGPTWFQMGENRHGDSLMFNGIHQEMLDNKVDTFSKAFQATTVACARCHDHKYDAIAQQDYYALGGVFMSSRWVTHTLDLPERNRKVLGELAALKKKLRKPLADWWLEEARQIPRYLLAAQAVVEGRMDAAEAAQDLDRARLAVWGAGDQSPALRGADHERGRGGSGRIGCTGHHVQSSLSLVGNTGIPDRGRATGNGMAEARRGVLAGSPGTNREQRQGLFPCRRLQPQRPSRRLVGGWCRRTPRLGRKRRFHGGAQGFGGGGNAPARRTVHTRALAPAQRSGPDPVSESCRPCLRQHGGDRRRLQCSPADRGQFVPDGAADLSEGPPSPLDPPFDHGRRQNQSFAESRRVCRDSNLHRVVDQGLEPQLSPESGTRARRLGGRGPGRPGVGSA